MVNDEVIEMWINEACKCTGLTKKAIEYYTLQGLVTPAVLGNGYRTYSDQDVCLLKKISVLRKLGLGVDEIRTILADTTGAALQTISVKKELDLQREALKKTLLDRLGCGAAYTDMEAELQALDLNKTITEKILEAFPGYYGRFVCLHFSRFLNEPIRTPAQRQAFGRIVDFLDNAPALDLPPELEKHLIENTNHIGTKQIGEMLESTRSAIENADAFLSENREQLEQYLAYKQSDAYKKSPAFKMMAQIKAFNQASGYYDVFIPALKELSSAYAAYYQQLELANAKLLTNYPEIEKLDNLGD